MQNWLVSLKISTKGKKRKKCKIGLPSVKNCASSKFENSSTMLVLNYFLVFSYWRKKVVAIIATWAKLSDDADIR